MKAVACLLSVMQYQFDLETAIGVHERHETHENT